LPVLQGVKPSHVARRDSAQPLPGFGRLDLAILAAGADHPVLAEVAETIRQRAGSPVRGAFYEDSPYVPPEQPSPLR